MAPHRPSSQTPFFLPLRPPLPCRGLRSEVLIYTDPLPVHFLHIPTRVDGKKKKDRAPFKIPPLYKYMYVQSTITVDDAAATLP
jgi:hypothetical protein